jgi:acyl-CoA reductase-like NAD-dependent aldehyde dehydrogenase
LLAALIAEGQRLLRRAHDAGGLPESLDGINTADLEAMVEELRTTQLQWEGDMTPQRREQILKKLFDVTRR